MISKKKAFTLTELLIVVIVIGVLSAVVLPKFNKVVETRKTTEAEEVMAAIRMEQEQRCSLNKQYTNDFTSFLQNGSLDLTASANNTARASSRNYDYALVGQMISAASKDSSRPYTLKMKSIEDGRVCCEGDYCAQLNKNYPLCENFTYVSSTAECVPEVTCTGEAGRQEVNHYNVAGHIPANCGVRYQRQICDTSSGTWTYVGSTEYENDESGCSVCTPTHNGQNSYTGSCPSGQTGTITYTWNSTHCTYDNNSATACTVCNPTHNGQASYTASCPSGQVGTITYTWNYSTCQYTDNSSTACTCAPTHNGQNSYTDCPSGKTGRTCTWDPSICDYNCVGTCSCTATPDHGNSYNPCPSGQGGRRCTWSTDSCSYNCTGTCTSWRCWYCMPMQAADPNPRGLVMDSNGKQFSFYYALDRCETCQKSQTKPTDGNCSDWVEVGFISGGPCYDKYPDMCPSTSC